MNAVAEGISDAIKAIISERSPFAPPTNKIRAEQLQQMKDGDLKEVGVFGKEDGERHRIVQMQTVGWGPRIEFDKLKEGLDQLMRGLDFRSALDDDGAAQAEQDGADQPATAPESKPEGKQKPQSESEERSH